MKRLAFFLAMIVLTLGLASCYINEQIDTNEMGVKLDGGKVVEVVGPGIYTELGWFQDLMHVKADTLTFSVDDPEVATRDNQLVGVTITVQARRQRSNDAVINLVQNWSSLIDNQVLMQTVSATTREGIKVGTRSFTLEELLNDRNGLASGIKTQIESDSEAYGVDIVNVTIENIALDPQYATQLNEKALLTAQIETELRRQDLIKQKASNDRLQQEQDTTIAKAQLEKEKATTDVQVEIASREGKKIAEQNRVYETNAKAFELERLKRLADVLGDRTIYYFVPEGTDLSLLLSQLPANVVPINP